MGLVGYGAGGVDNYCLTDSWAACGNKRRAAFSLMYVLVFKSENRSSIEPNEIGLPVRWVYSQLLNLQLGWRLW